MKKLLALITLLLPMVAQAKPVEFKLSDKTTFILPLQVVQAVQLYCPEEGKGFPGLETVLVERKSWRLSAGAAPVLGTDVNVPFVSVSTRLSPVIFDTSDNTIYFGVWAGKPSNKRHAVFGLSAGIPLW